MDEVSAPRTCAAGPVAASCYPQNFMPTDQILSLLIAERDKLNRAIEALQGPAKRRGRPPKNPLMVAAPAVASAPKKRRRRRSAAQRKAQAERMKAYWAAKRKRHAKA